jgi:hypothetical protein
MGWSCTTGAQLPHLLFPEVLEGHPECEQLVHDDTKAVHVTGRAQKALHQQLQQAGRQAGKQAADIVGVMLGQPVHVESLLYFRRSH